MKKYLFAALALAMGAISGPSVHAEETPKYIDLAKQEIQLTISMLEMQRKNTIAQNLQVSMEEINFWSVYNDYRSEMLKGINRHYKIITEYADALDSKSLSDEVAAKLLDRYLNALGDQVKVKKKYVRKFKKVLSAKKVVRFYQLDNRIDLIMNMQIAKSVPLVR